MKEVIHMITYKVQNTATAEERIPVKMEWNEKGELVTLQVRRGESVEDIEPVNNWKIVPIYECNDRETQKVAEENKKKKEKWSI